jgi:hypothetical protein
MECGNLLPLWSVATCRDQLRSCGETTATSRRIPKRRQVAALQNFGRSFHTTALYFSFSSKTARAIAIVALARGASRSKPRASSTVRL